MFIRVTALEMSSYLKYLDFFFFCRQLLRTTHIDVSYFAAGIIAHLASDGEEAWRDIAGMQRADILEELVSWILLSLHAWLHWKNSLAEEADFNEFNNMWQQMNKSSFLSFGTSHSKTRHMRVRWRVGRNGEWSESLMCTAVKKHWYGLLWRHKEVNGCSLAFRVKWLQAGNNHKVKWLHTGMFSFSSSHKALFIKYSYFLLISV